MASIREQWRRTSISAEIAVEATTPCESSPVFLVRPDCAIWRGHPLMNDGDFRETHKRVIRVGCRQSDPGRANFESRRSRWNFLAEACWSGLWRTAKSWRVSRRSDRANAVFPAMRTVCSMIGPVSICVPENHAETRFAVV